MRTGDARITKRLDRFLIFEYFMQGNFFFHQWVSSGGVSDHSPILFELSPNPIKPPFPFNFNSSNHPIYLDLVRNTWTPLNENLPEAPPIQFIENIKRVKKEMIAWINEKKIKENQTLMEIEQQFKEWMHEEMDTNFYEEQKYKILLLEKKKNELLSPEKNNGD
jgi:hypothetical protein